MANETGSDARKETQDGRNRSFERWMREGAERIKPEEKRK